MKLYFFTLLGCFFSIDVFATTISVFSKPNCSLCNDAKKFILNQLIDGYMTVTVNFIDVSEADNKSLYNRTLDVCKLTEPVQFPIILFNTTCLTGFNEANKTFISNNSQVTNTAQNSEQPKAYSAKHIKDEWSKNSFAFEKKYANKPIQIRGKIVYIWSDGMVGLATNSSLPEVKCTFKDTDAVLNLSMAQTIEVECISEARGMLYPDFKDCVLK